MKTVGIVSKPDKREAASLALALRERFPEHVYLVEAHLARLLDWPAVSSEELGWRSDLIVVLGGDGTLIHAARSLKGRAVPILGINLGSLGFLTESTSAELFGAFEAAVNGRAKVEARMKVTCRLLRAGALVLDDEALNDIVVHRSALARMVDLEASFDGALLTVFKADGLIIATPTGSTAYSLSAGGPLVHPAVDAVIVTPISPHALTQRPIVVPGDRLLRAELVNDGSDAYLSIDGKAGVPVQRGDRLEVQRSANRAHLVCNEARDYFSILREKLRWGER